MTRKMAWILGLALLLGSVSVSAQDRQSGLEAYSDDRFQEALDLLQPLDEDSEAQLYAAKSALALGQYDLSSRLLLDLSSHSLPSALSQETSYTLALVRFRQRQPYSALQLLFPLKEQGMDSIQGDAREIYNEILGFMTLDQIRAAFRLWDNPYGQMDLILPASRIGGASVGRSMIGLLRESNPGLEQALSRLEASLRSIPERSTLDVESANIPDGMVYHIGVMLPESEQDEATDQVSRQLYSGLLLAMEEQNRSTTNQKFQLRFHETASSQESAVSAFHQLVWDGYSDLIVGPLFSESATVASRLAEQYQVPLITPLANTGHINEGHHYSFQLNPDLASHGVRMARQAVQEMGMDTLAVFTQSGAIGRSSAVAFRNEAERLGAHVAWFIEEPYRERGYDLAPILDRMFPSTVETTEEEIDTVSEPQPTIDGVYAPFTGQESETLASMLLTELEGRNLHYPIMGSQVWASLRYTNAQHARIPIFYSRGYRAAGPGEEDARFVEEFRNQFGFEPDEFARLGFDAGRFLTETMLETGNPARLHHAIRSSDFYSGLILDIEFNGFQMNQRVQILPATDRAREIR